MSVLVSDPPQPSVPKDVLVNTRAVLLSSRHGVLLGKFKGDYKKLVGKLNSFSSKYVQQLYDN